MNSSHLSSLVAATLLSVATAQQFETLPTSASTADGNSSYVMPGFSSDARQQVLIDAQLIGPQHIGQSLVSVAVRRDLGWDYKLRGGLADLTVVVSAATRSASSASPVFDVNSDAASRAVVFQGQVAIPNSPAVLGRSAGWTDPRDTVQIPFTRGFLYTGGGLCIEVIGRQVSGYGAGAWPIDAVHDSASGSVAVAGDSCGSMIRAATNPFLLVPGFSISFAGDGPAGVPGVFLLGTSIPAIDLAAYGLGGPGCELRVAPWISIVTLFEDYSADGILEGAATVRFQIPADPGVLSMPFSCQFVGATVPIETTNSLECVLAGSMPSIGMSSVRAQFDGATIPSEGQVWTTRAPVLRLEYR